MERYVNLLILLKDYIISMVILLMLDNFNRHTKHKYVLNRSEGTLFICCIKYTVLSADTNVRPQ
jgi:hypothetical protein